MKPFQTIILLLAVAVVAFTAGRGSATGMNTNTQFWSGHIVIYRDSAGQSHIDYRSDIQVKDTTYTPNGFFENHAVNGVIKRIMTP